MSKINWKGRLRLFLTLRCNMVCHFCNNNCPGKVDFSTIEEAGFDKYSELFRLINAEQVIIEGGEPTLHRDFTDIINLSIRTYKDTIIYSNGKRYGINKILQLDNNNLHICLSFHPTEMSKEEFLEGYMRLVDRDFKFYWISAVEDRYNMTQLVETVDWLKQKGISMLSIVPNSYYEALDKCVSGRRYKVICYGLEERLISPDLRVYICHSHMFTQNRHYSSDILSGEKVLNNMVCDAGLCSMCDRDIRKNLI